MAAQLFYTGSSAGALANAGKGPVTDNIVTVEEILLRHAGFVKKMGLDAPYLGKSSAHGELKKRMPCCLVVRHREHTRK